MIRERLPSCSRACKPKPASRLRETVKKRATAHRFAFYPPVLLVRRASSFRPASALVVSPPTGLSTVRRPERAMCPTDVCHSNELTAPAPRTFPALSPDLRRAESPRSLRSPRSMTGGTNVSRRPNRFGGFRRTRFPLCGASRAEAVTDPVRRRGRIYSHGARRNRASDIPVASHSFPRSHEPSPVQPLSSIRLRPFGCACGSLG